MNERIRELVEQAGAVTGTDLTNVTDALVLIGEEEIQAFAALIVRECVHIAYNKIAIQKASGVRASVVCDAMKEHFGVEE